MAIAELELKRARWRCRRGLLENDLVLQRFFERRGAELDAAQLAALGELLELPDPELWELVSGRRECDNPRLAAIVAIVREA